MEMGNRLDLYDTTISNEPIVFLTIALYLIITFCYKAFNALFQYSAVIGRHVCWRSFELKINK